MNQTEITHDEIDRAMENAQPNQTVAIEQAPEMPVGESVQQAAGEAATAPQAIRRVESDISIQGGVKPSSAEQLVWIAKVAAQSKLLPSQLNTPEAAFLAMAFGMEVGISPMQSLRSVYVVDGKAALYGDAPLALVRRSGQLTGYSEDYDSIDAPGVELAEWDDEWGVTVKASREGQGEFEATYTVSDAKQAGLWMKTGRSGGKGPWWFHPKRMLMYRARGIVLRTLFPDILAGFYGFEELDETGSFDPTRMKANGATRDENAEAIIGELEA